MIAGRHLADCRRLAHTVDAYDQNDLWMMHFLQILLVILQKFFHCLFHERHDFVRIVDRAFGNTAADLPHQEIRRADTDIPGKKYHFQVFQEVLVNRCIADDNALYILDQRLFCLCQPFANFIKKSHCTLL